MPHADGRVQSCDSSIRSPAPPFPPQPQLLPLSPADAYLRETYYAYGSAAATQWLAFSADLPACGYTSAFITPVASAAAAPLTVASRVVDIRPTSGLASINNSRVTLTFDAQSGLLAAYADSATGVSSPVTQELRYYSASPGDWDNNLPAAGVCSRPPAASQRELAAPLPWRAGAYFMRPVGNATTPVGGLSPVPLQLVEGPVVSEARQVRHQGAGRYGAL